MTVYIIVIFLACLFVDVIVEVVALMLKFSCAPPLVSLSRCVHAGED